MNKILLLGLGIVPLAIVPVATAVSCSSNKTEEVSAIDKEVLKFKEVLKTTNTTKNINEAQAEFLAEGAVFVEVLKTYSNIELDTKSFEFTVAKPSNSKIVDNVLDVSIMVTEKTTTETPKASSKPATLKLTGFVSTLELEAAKFPASYDAKDKALVSSDVVKTINEQTTSEKKIEQVVSFIKGSLPILSEGFTLSIQADQKAVSLADKTMVTISATITDVNGKVGSNTKIVSFNITGFTAPSTSTK